MAGIAAASFAGTALARAAQPPKPRIKVGQIGTGHAHASGKMTTLRQFAEDWEVVGLVEPDAALRERLAADPAYRDVPLLTEEQLLAVPGLQAVVVETAVRDLIPAARRCVAADLHVHVDKPAGESLGEFKSLLDEATSRGRVVQMGYMFRYNPAFLRCFDAVRQGWLGDVFELHAVMSKKVDAASRLRLAEYPGGTMFELGCHLIDAAVAILGPPDNVVSFTRHNHGERDSLADNQLAVLEYPRATASIRSTVLEPHGGERRQFTVCGERGTFDIRPLEPPQLRVSLESAAGPYAAGIHDVPLPPAGGRYDGDFADLAAIVRGEKPADYSPAHDLAVQDAILRASGLAVE